MNILRVKRADHLINNNKDLIKRFMELMSCGGLIFFLNPEALYFKTPQSSLQLLLLLLKNSRVNLSWNNLHVCVRACVWCKCIVWGGAVISDRLEGGDLLYKTIWGMENYLKGKRKRFLAENKTICRFITCVFFNLNKITSKTCFLFLDVFKR